MSGFLSDDTKIVDVLDHAEGNSDRTSSSVDCQGFDSALFVVKFGDIAAGATTSIKLQQSSDDGSSDSFADIKGSAQSVAADDDNQIFYVDVQNVGEQFLKLVVDKDASNNTEEMAWALLYDAGNRPTSHPTGVQGETHVRPAEGTA